ncbi:Signal transduction histidine kinase [Granulicella rosea]|uniref:Signal transduction histidine kinase n=2 Tax=Granulicella rosea TaxID=474952 RepID=A0A239HJ01_9BACT|nr:Signal transduction histidine kinase [Granulicella rosea]
MVRPWLRFFLLVCLCKLGVCPAWAVDPSSRITQYGHTAWRLSDGMFEGAPNVIAQTPDGYLWVGTAAGLLRFDGVRFIRWEGVGDVKLPHGGIHSLFTAKDGSLWIGAGASLSHLQNGVLFNYSSEVALIVAIVQDDSGTIWAARQNLVVGGGLCKVAGLTLDCAGPSKTFPFPFGGAMAADHNGNLWVGAGGSYVRWSPISHTVYTPKLFEHLADIEGVRAVATAPDGRLLVGLAGVGAELGLEEIVDGAAKPYPVRGFDTTKIEIQKILFDRHGALWLGTPNGIYRIYRDVVDRYRESDGLSGGVVDDLFEDREGNMWVVTSQGIDRLRDLPIKTFGKKEGLTIDAVQSLFFAKDGALWVVNGNGLDVLRSGATISIEHEARIGPGDPIGVATQDNAGGIWIGRGNRLFRYDHGTMHQIAAPAGSPTDSTVESYAEDAQGDMWVAFGPSREIWKVHDDVATRFMVKTRLPSVYDMAFDHKGNLWIGDINGNLARIWGESIERIPFPHRGLPKALLQIAITDDDAVMGTTAGGVVLYKDGKEQTLGLGNGLPCENFRSFVFDHSANLWLTSECGTMEILHRDWMRWRQNPKAIVRPLLLDTLDGARFTEGFLTRAAAMTEDGKLWFADGNQLQMIDPANLARNVLPPLIRIEELFADGTSLGARQNISIPPLTRQLQIDYTATSLSNPQRVLFRYKLEGHDKDWQLAGTRRQAFYNDLKPGRYRFTVLACNNSGLWNEIGSSIIFTIAPAWFQTRWFMALSFLSAAMLLYGFYRLRVTQLRKRLQLQYTTRLEERTRVARDLHDTLLQTIQGTKLVAEEALHGSDDLTQLHNVVAKIHEWLSRAVIEGRAALTALRTGSHAGDLAERLRAAAEECSKDGRMEVEFDCIGVPVELSSSIMEEVFRIGYEAIRNACAHSQGRALEVQLIYAKALKLTVKDNGIGFDVHGASGRASGHYGLDGMRERAQQLGASLSVVSKVGSGTEVILIARFIK